MPERGPWEDYQSTAVETGPWEDYKASPPPPTAPKQPTPLEKFYEAVGENLGWPVVRDLLALGARTGKTDAEKLAKAKETVGGLLQGVAAEPGRVSQALRSFQDTLARGDIPGAAYHLAGGVPLIGAPAQQVAQDLEQGEYARAAGHAVGLAVPFTKPIAKAGVVRAGQAAEAVKPVVKGAVREAVKESLAPSTVKAKYIPVEIPVPRIVSSAVTGKLAGSYLGGPVGGAVGLTVGAGVPIVRGAVRGARQVLKARAAAAAEALRAQTLAERPPIIPPERQLAAPPEAIRGPIITPAPPDTSYVRGIPAEYPEVIPPALRGKPAAEAAARELQTALQEPEPAVVPEPDITPRNATAQTAAHELATEQIAQMLHDNGISAQDALTFDPSDWQNLTSSVMRGTTDVPPSLTRDVTMRLREIERSAAPSSAPPMENAPPVEPLKPQTVAQAQAEFKAAKKAAAQPEPLEAWQIRKAGLVPREEMVPRPKTPYDVSGGYTEAEINARALRARAGETEPPDITRHPVGSWGVDADGELMQLREYSLDDPKLIFMETPGRNQTVEKYIGWIEQGNEPPPLRAVETEKGSIRIQEGNHRAAAIRATGGNKVKVWTAVTKNRPIGQGQVMPEGVTHESAIRNALAEGRTIPPEVLADYPEIKSPAQALRAEMGLAEGEMRTPPGEAKPAPTASETRVNRLAKDIAEGKLAMAEVEKFNTPQGRMILEDHAVRKGMARPARGEVEQIIAKVRELREGAAVPQPQTVAQAQAEVRAAKKASSNAPLPASMGVLPPVEATAEFAKLKTSARATQPEPVSRTAEKIPEPRRPVAGVTAATETAIRVPGESQAYRANYAVRELEEIQPSHNPVTFEKNPAYHHRNDRNYSDAANQERIVLNSQRFDPAYLLTDSPDAINGAPVTDLNGNVLGGNSRRMILERVYRSNPGGAAAYRAELMRRAQQFGIDPAQIEGMRQPMLVRELLPEQDVTPQRTITQLNKVGTAELTAAERATADARMLSVDAADYLAGAMEAEGADATLADVLSGKRGAAVIQKLVDDGVFTTQEKPKLVDSRTGSVTAAAKERITKMLLGQVFESSDQMMRTPLEIRNKIERIVSPLVRSGKRAGFDLLPTAREAIDLLEYAQAHGIRNLEDAIAQEGLFGAAPKFSPQAVELAEFIRSQKPTEISRAFRRYVTSSEPTMFGESTPAEAFADAFGGK